MNPGIWLSIVQLTRVSLLRLNHSMKAIWRTGVLIRVVFTGVTLVLAGCATLKPVDLPEETAFSPAEAPLWAELETVRRDDWIHLLNAGGEAMEWRLRAIDSATRSIDLQTFLWDDDVVGLTLLQHLLDAADRGVRVRLLLDDTFTVSHAEEIWSIDHHPNIDLRIYNPFRRRYDGMLARQLMNLAEFGRLDHRMHNKALIVDNRVAILGGRNIADEYFGNHEEANFRDMDLLMGGPTVLEVSQLFDQFWNNDWTFPEELLVERPREELTPEAFHHWVAENGLTGLAESDTERALAWKNMVMNAYRGEIRLIADEPAPNQPADEYELPTQLADELIRTIDSAQHELILVSAYLIPSAELESAIERAEDRGVEVRILTNSIRSNNHLAAHSAYRKHVKTLISHGAELHEVRALAKDRHVYMETPVDTKHLGLHAKFTIIDNDLSIIGSANLDPRSLRLNTEMALIIHSEALNQKLREFVELDFHPRNAWHLQPQPDGSIHWVADDETHLTQPAESIFQALEDWFIGLLPIEGEM